jgi:hypothetical protein
MTFLYELWSFIRIRKKYWLVPVIFATILLAGLLMVSPSSPVAPLIYAIF